MSTFFASVEILERNICDVEETSDGPIIPGIVVTSVQQLRKRWREGDATARTIVDTSEVFIVDEAHQFRLDTGFE